MQRQLSKKEKLLSQFFCSISEIYIKLWAFSKKMILIAYVFPKLRTAKEVVRQMSKKPHFTTPFDSQHANGFETAEICTTEFS